MEGISILWFIRDASHYRAAEEQRPAGMSLGGRCDLAGADGGKSEDDRMQAGQEERSMAVAGVRYIGTAPKQGRRRPHRT